MISKRLELFWQLLQFVIWDYLQSVYQLRLGRQRQVWLIPIADECVGVQVKLWNPLRTRVIPERFCGSVSLRRGAISSVCTFTFTDSSTCAKSAESMPPTPTLSRVRPRSPAGLKLGFDIHSSARPTARRSTGIFDNVYLLRWKPERRMHYVMLHTAIAAGVLWVINGCDRVYSFCSQHQYNSDAI